MSIVGLKVISYLSFFLKVTLYSYIAQGGVCLAYRDWKLRCLCVLTTEGINNNSHERYHIGWLSQFYSFSVSLAVIKSDERGLSNTACCGKEDKMDTLLATKDAF